MSNENMLTQDFKNTYIIRKTAHAVTIVGKRFINECSGLSFRASVDNVAEC